MRGKSEMVPMRGKSEDQAVVARLWQEHLDAEFPAGTRGAELAGCDMALLDADIAGCVSTWLDNDGSLDAWRRQVLRRCIAELDKTLPLLTDTAALRYYRRLHRLALLTAQASGCRPVRVARISTRARTTENPAAHPSATTVGTE